MAAPHDPVTKVPLLPRGYPRRGFCRAAARPRARLYFPPILQACVSGFPEAPASLAQIEINLPESHPLWAALALTPLPSRRILRRRRRS